MKAGVFFLLLCPFFLFCQQWDPQPLMPLTTDYPIEMDMEGRQDYLKPPENQIRKYQAKTFPWNGVLCLVALFFAAVILRSRNIIVPLKEEDFKEKAKFARAKALQSIGLLSPNKLTAKNYFVELSNVVRSFIEERYQIRAQTETTEEFFDELKEHPIFDEKMQNLLKSFMNSTDLAKYSLHQPTRQEQEWAARAAQEFVDF